MTLREAIITVLREAQKPLHTSEITKRVLEQKLWETSGKTPEATVSAYLSTEIKKKSGFASFVKDAPNTYGINDKVDVTSIPEALSTSPSRKKEKSSLTKSFTESAIMVLEKLGKKQPMHYRDITETALKNDWLKTEGKTPEATMYAQILTEVKRYQARGAIPRFTLHGKGMVGLTKWEQHGLLSDFEQHNKKVREKFLSSLLALNPYEFEKLIAEQLLPALGFETVEITKQSNDGGIDVRGTMTVGETIKVKMAVQVKRWKPSNKVQAPIVQQIRGSLGAHEQGLIITTSDFSPGARAEATKPDRNNISLMNGDELAAALMEHEIGIKKTMLTLFELDDTQKGIQ